MSSNKKPRERLEERYGKECFIEKLHLRKDDTPRTYTSKGQMKRMKQLTYHHIVERCKGGQATVENGALLSRRKSYLVQCTNQRKPSNNECYIPRI